MKYYDQENLALLHADVLAGLAQIESESVQCVVTSPPYWGLRDYRQDGQIGLEPTVDAYLERMVAVFREVGRVVKPDGTLWLNIGDLFKNKKLVGLPWRVAFALQADGWYLRSDIVWHKPNPMPESVTDRPTRAHEYLFLLTRSERYFYDAAAIREPAKSTATYKSPDGWDTGPGAHGSFHKNGREKGKLQGTPHNRHTMGEAIPEKERRVPSSLNFRRAAPNEDLVPGQSKTQKRTDRADTIPNGTANKRDVWTVATVGYKGSHFATFPPKLVEPCILAGSKPGDTVLDPFCGTGTALQVALAHGRRAVGIDLNSDYLDMTIQRINKEGECQKHK